MAKHITLTLGLRLSYIPVDRFSEIETLSPMAQIKPGESIPHIEKWKLFKVGKPIKGLSDNDYLNSFILPAILSGL